MLKSRLSLLGALAIWLFVLVACTAAFAQSWQPVPGGRFQTLTLPPTGPAGFALLPPRDTGIWFTNVLEESRHLTNQILPNGSGVAAGDVDGDSWCDLYFCGLSSSNRLYRNLGGWKFQDVTESAGVACPNLDATGAALADLDGDGDLDLVVNSLGGGTHIFVNDGKGHFAAGPQVLNPGLGGTSLALADVDGDGDLDLYVANYRVSALVDAPGTRFSVKMINNQPVVTMVNGRPLTDPEWTNRFAFKFARGEGNQGKFAYEELGEPDAFFLNDGRGRFEPVSWTGGAFLDEQGQPLLQPPFDWGLSALFRDLNDDGFPDLYVCNDFGTPDRVWINDGRGRFRALPRLAIRQTSLASMGVDVADVNRDGFDDIFVTDMLSREHRRRLTQRNILRPELAPAGEITGRPQYPRNTLLLGNGDGTYAEAAQFAGLEASEWSWAPVFLDVDLDGYEDLLVPNGFARDNMNLDAMNRINAIKANRRLSRLEELQLRREFPPLATANLAFRNLGNLRFEEVSRRWGFDTPGISQGICRADLDNDGDLDVIVNNLNAAAGVYRNDGAAARVGARLKGHPPNTRGIGAKIFVFGGAVPRQSQEMNCGGRYLSSDDAMRVFAAGTTTNRMRLEVQWRSGKRSLITNAEPNRIYEIAEDSAINREETTDHGPRTTDETPSPKSKVQSPKSENHVSRFTYHGPPIFQDVSELITHTHHDDPFDDFLRQPLLPKRLSQLGPGVSWYDLSGDGKEDLVVGSGKGGQCAVFLNDGQGGFKSLAEVSALGGTGYQPTAIELRLKSVGRSVLAEPSKEQSLNRFAARRDGLALPTKLLNSTAAGRLPAPPSSQTDSKLITKVPWNQPMTRDQTSVLGWTAGPAKTFLVAGSANYEDGLAEGGCVKSYDPSSGQISDLLAGQSASIGPLALGDVDGDGDLDLFVGGRSKPGRYPEPATSLLLKNENGRWVVAQRFEELGLVSGAVFSDLDGDGKPELVLACEWGPILIFQNEDGKLTRRDWPVTMAEGITLNSQLSTLNQLNGWWNSVTTGDFDGDGRLDIVAGNWGGNSKYESFRSRPLRLYYGDLESDGVVDLFETHFDLAMQKYVPERMLDDLTKALPFLSERFTTHEAYAQASIEEVLGERRDRMRFLEANWLESTIFLNRSGRFEVQVLPTEAQLSPAFGVCVGDYDGDGREDIFLGQNFFDVGQDTARYDAGRGLWLQGIGNGGFRAVPGQESGVKIYGEQRGAALCDYDGDGRVDLVVGQNSAETRLFHNTGGRPGLRVRIVGPAGNPFGVGAVMRIQSGNRLGPAREIHAGAGYWSQDSAIQVIALPEAPAQLQVRWPGGRTSTSEIPSGAREIAVEMDGKVKIVR